MEREDWNPWGDGPLNDDELEGYIRWQESLHDYERDKEDTFGRCKYTLYRRDGSPYRCNQTSHATNHLPMSCCYCEHGVYLHTSYDIPCGKCEMGSIYE